MSLSDEIISLLVDKICSFTQTSIHEMHENFLEEKRTILSELEESECYTDHELTVVRTRLEEYPFLFFIQDTFEQNKEEQEGISD